MTSGRFQLLIAIILFASLGSLGQTLPPQTADDQMGTQPFQSYHGGDIDSVGLSNGTLSLDFPFLAYPQRGQLHLDFHLYYNNQPQHIALFCAPTTPPQCLNLWGYSPGVALPVEKGDVFVGWAQQMVITGTGMSQKQGSTTNAPTWYWDRWSLQTADGVTHPLGNLGSVATTTDCNGCGSYTELFFIGTGPWETLDATGIRVNGALTAERLPAAEVSASGAVGPDGIVAGTEDPNGNTISTTADAFGIATAFTDTLGRQIPAPPTASSSSNVATTACPAGALPVDHAVQWSVPGPNGGTSNYTFCYAKITINISRTSSPPAEPKNATVINLQSIVLPDGHSWSFQYNDTDGTTNANGPVNYGTLTRITLPTGGTISYTYSTMSVGGISCQNTGRFVTGRTVSANDGTGGHTWTYGYGSNSSGVPTTTVTDPSGNYTVHTFGLASGGCAFYETETQNFSATGTLLKTVNTTYTHTAPSVARNSHGLLNVVPVQITTILANGKTSTVTKSYDSGFSYLDYQGGSTGTDNSTPNVGIYGKELAESASDFGNPSPGGTLKTTSTSYLALNNSTYLGANLLNLPSSTAVIDGSGCKQAETDYTYDESSYLTTYGGTLPAGSHGAAPNSVRGNPTSIKHQLFTANTCPTTAQSGPTSHTNWYDTGELYQATDPLGNTTTHSYDSFYAGAYSTQTCNALNQCVSGTYDFNSGLLTSFTDANGSSMASGNTPGDAAHTTTLQYNDPLWRLTQVQSPADPNNHNPVTTINYPDANTVERVKTITTTLTDDSFSYFDGVGRHYKSVHTSVGSATTVTSYDADGHVASVTNPYFKTSDPTYGVTSTQYDGLGRVTQTTKQDSSVVTTQYNQSAASSTNSDCTVVTDEAGNPRQACNDGLGRMIEVDEPGAAYAGIAATGSVTVNGTLQSASVPNPNGPFTKGQASFSVTSDGSGQNGDRVVNITTCHRIGNNNVCTTVPSYDNGNITVTVNGFTTQAVPYGATAVSTLATNIASALNATGSPVTATPSGSTVTMTANTAGPSGNYAWSSSSVTSNSNFAAGSTSYPLVPAFGSLTGGSQAMMTIYDYGTVTVTVGSFAATVCYGNNPAPSCGGQVNNTSAQVAAALAGAVNVPSSPATAGVSGSTISFINKTPGIAGDLSVTISSSSANSTQFSTGSFSGSGALSGGSDPYPSGLAHPYVTLYTYDVLGNLLNVTQKGGTTDSTQWRVRTFTYDSLSRLLTATNPESGTIGYSYDADGNLLQKTSPAPNQTGGSTQTISYCYDALNRVTGKGYGAQICPLSAPVVSYIYDVGTNGVGRLTSLTDQAGIASYSYDALGRITSESRTIAGIQKTLGYTYNLDNSIATLTYPSSAVVTYAPDAAGRALSAVDTANTINYVTSASYGPDSSLTGFVSGNNGTFNGVTNTWQYNTRLQICRITAQTTGTVPKSCTDSADTGNVLDLGYNLNLGNGDNGNVIGITNYKDTTRNQSFTYDTLNRLTSAQNAGTDCTQTTLNGTTKYWGNNYGYDAWGNLLTKSVSKCSAENLSVAALANNQLSGYGYDAAGNMTHDATTGNNYAYDPENRITGAAGYTYAYDADGNRVEKSSGSSGTIYWYMTPGIVAESDLGGNLKSEYVFFGAQRVARKDFSGNNSSVSYYFSDHLKTASVITDASGAIKSESDFYPWGGELQLANADANRYKFTGKERDGETGLDYFGKRYYENALSRFVTPDPLLSSGRPSNPQSWNRYTYVENNPLRYTDPTGLYKWGKCSGGVDECKAKQQRFRDSITKAEDALKNLDPNSKEAKALRSTLEKLGKEGKGDVKINFGDAGKTDGRPNLGKTVGHNITINYEAVDAQAKAFNLNPSEKAALDAGVTAHEGTHALGNGFKGLFQGHFEHPAYYTESVTYQGLHNTDRPFGLWNESWANLDQHQIDEKRENAIQDNIHPNRVQQPQQNQQ